MAEQAGQAEPGILDVKTGPFHFDHGPLPCQSFPTFTETAEIISMLIYSVTISIEESKAQAFQDWMLRVHIPDVMTTGRFTAWRLVEVKDPPPEGPVRTFNAQYSTSEADLQLYLDQDAPALREDVKTKFGNNFATFRTLLTEIGAG